MNTSTRIDSLEGSIFIRIVENRHFYYGQSIWGYYHGGLWMAGARHGSFHGGSTTQSHCCFYESRWCPSRENAYSGLTIPSNKIHTYGLICIIGFNGVHNLACVCSPTIGLAGGQNATQIFRFRSITPAQCEIRFSLSPNHNSKDEVYIHSVRRL